MSPIWPPTTAGRSPTLRRLSTRECHRRVLRLEWLEDRRVLSSGPLAWGLLDSPEPSLAAAAAPAFNTWAEPVVVTSHADFAATAAGEWIVQYAAPVSGVDDRESMLGSCMLDAATRAGVRATLSNLTARDFGLLRAPGATASDLAAWAVSDPTIAAVSPNFIYQLHRLPNDPALDFDHPDHRWSEVLWGLKNEGETGLVVGSYAPDSVQAGLVDVDIDAPEAWDLSTGSDQVVLAIIDSGVDYTHPDLAGNIWENARDPLGDFDGDGNLDDDGNGFADDVHGWDFVGDDRGHPRHDNDPADPLGHGTHVAGIVGAVGNNGEGVVGVNWNVSLLPLKIADQHGMISTAAAVEALDYLVRLKTAGVQIAAANASWGNSFGVVDPALEQAIGRVNEYGIVFVASAGNDSHYSAGYPASSTQPNVISVAALNRENQLAFFSNYNDEEIDLAAPGDAILSTFLAGQYEVHSGTSMAAPYVTGVVGLLAAASQVPAPYQTIQQGNGSAAAVTAIKNALTEGIVLNENLTGKVAASGNLNALNSLQAFLHAGPIVRDLSVAVTTLSTDQIVVDFSQEILADSVTSASVQAMTAGTDGILGTSDDVSVPTSDVVLETPLRAVLSFPSILDLGPYRLVVEADGLDVHGNELPPVRGLTGLPIYDGVDFIFDFEVVPVPGMFEPNDWLAVAFDTGIRGDGMFDTIAISPAPEIGDGLQPHSDIDFFSLVVPQRSLLHAEVNAGPSSNLDPLLRLFDAGGNELLMMDDGMGSESSLSVVLREPGTYYVAVSAFGNSVYDPHQPAEATHSLTLGAYDLALRVEADLPEFLFVSGSVRHELIGDAIRDAIAPPLTGWTVFVDMNENGILDSADVSTQTMSDGRYLLDGLAAGTYAIGLATPSGWYATTPTLREVDLRTAPSAVVDFAARIDTSQRDSFHVTSALDRLSNTAISHTNSAAGLSLREAIQLASWYPQLPLVTISQDIPRITLQKGQLRIEDTELVVRGSDELHLVQIDGNRQDRVFFVGPQAALTLSHVALTGGFAPRATLPASLAETQGGALYNAGAVSLYNVQVSQNEAGEDGGGLYNSFDAEMTLDRTLVYENLARSLRSQRIELELRFNSSLVPFTFTTGGGGGIANHGELFVTNNTLVARNGSNREGGGVYVGKAGSLHATQSSILDNVAAAGGGGGVFAYAHGTETAAPQLLELTDTTVSQNTATAPPSCGCFIIAAGGGGGVLATEFDNTVDWTFNASVGLVGVTISDNRAYDHGGGAFVVASQLNLRNTAVHGNAIESGHGGGLFVTAIGTVLDNVTVFENIVAPLGHGGGMYFDAEGELQITNSQFVGNQLVRDPTLLNGGAGQGGGLYARSGTVDISNSLFVDNVSVSDGGGIRNYLGDMTVLNTTVSHNSTLLSFNNLWGRGGGISSGTNLNQGFSRLVVVNSTITENVAVGKAGGITLKSREAQPFQPDPLNVVLNQTGVIHNSIVAGNFTSYGGEETPDDVDGPSWDPLSSYNVFGVLPASSPLRWGEGTLAGSLSGPVDAGLQPLAQNGGPTRTHALFPTSPAVDLASDEVALSFDIHADQRGFSRFLDGNGNGLTRIDAGAYEWVYGDLDGNGALSAADIDLLCQHFGDAKYDLNGNGFTDSGDLDTLVHDILHTEFGDANLDGVVDGVDFILWNANKFGAGGWQQGDFNGDHFVDENDFGIWFGNFGFRRDPTRRVIRNCSRAQWAERADFPSWECRDPAPLWVFGGWSSFVGSQ